MVEWYAVETRRDAEVARDLASLGVPVLRPEYTIDYWDGRRSVRRQRTLPLIPGYLLVGVPVITAGTTRHRVRYLLGADGRPAVVHDAPELIRRCESREFDVHGGQQSSLSPGARVLVALLGAVGTVVQSLGRARARVRLDAGCSVTVPCAALEVV